MSFPKPTQETAAAVQLEAGYDWLHTAETLFISRALDQLEESRLVPEGKVLYQFSARGHDLAQILLGALLGHPHDAASGYYRSRPLLLALGLEIEDAIAGPLAVSGSYSDGRDIGVVCNMPEAAGAIMLPMSGSVGSQYTPTAGWAQGIQYYCHTLQESAWQGAIAVSLGGDASVASNGFWAALTMATTLKLPLLFYIEDNGYGISVPGHMQTPGGDISVNLAAFQQLKIFAGDGTEPAQAAALIKQAVNYTRQHLGPVLLRLKVPRLSGHSAQDTQAYKTDAIIEQEKKQDPLLKLHKYLVPMLLSEAQWQQLQAQAAQKVEQALALALARPQPDPSQILRHVFCEFDPQGKPLLQQRGGLWPSGYQAPQSNNTSQAEPARINMLTAIRKTMAHELAINPKVMVFGEDVGPKGGVHGATMGLQQQFGVGRVFDTSLSEEGIIGRAVGLAYAGLMPVAEIQFRKYADPATEQLNDCGTIRWRTANQFAAPIVVRIPGGFGKCGDPWHSACNEVAWIHNPGWQVAYPSNAEDACGLLRAAMRDNNPTIFFEHRALLDRPWARRPYPGDDFVLPFGKAKLISQGQALSVVTWGAMVERCVLASAGIDVEVEIIDLRTLSPWDKPAVLTSIAKTKRCLVVHEDTLKVGFGAEIMAVLAKEAFFDLDAPLERLTMPDIPSPYNTGLLDAVLPSADSIRAKMLEIIQC